MATTYDRLHVLLLEVQRNDARKYPRARNSFIDSMVSRNLVQFRIRVKAKNKIVEKSISEKALNRLLQLLKELKFIRLPEPDRLEITPRGNEALEEDKFANAISVATFQLLAEYGVTRQVLVQIIQSIHYPDLPDAETIYTNLDNGVRGKVDIEKFRRLLYLLACAGGLEREIKVFYVA